ncbi:hypothetical protein EB052_00025 [bacterium]|nr:hypothetical protein [bacterium]
MNKILPALKKPVTIVSILFVLSTAGFIYYFTQYSRVTKTPAQDAKELTLKKVNEIKELMVITDDSGAVLATIADKSKLAGQKFFDAAQNGDDVILFPAMQKVVLYRSSIHRIIDVGPFTTNNSQTNAQAVATSTLGATKTVTSGTAAKKIAPATTTK